MDLWEVTKKKGKQTCAQVKNYINTVRTTCLSPSPLANARYADGFIDNIKLEIRDVRVEYENSFKLNLRIASLTLRSADSFGRFVFVDSSAQSVRKIATMSGLSISHAKSGKQAFQDILKPTSISLTLSSSGLFVRISSVLLELNSSQLRDLLHELRHFSSRRRLEEFARMHRPNGRRPVTRRSAKLWWRYAVCCVRSVRALISLECNEKITQTHKIIKCVMSLT